MKKIAVLLLLYTIQSSQTMDRVEALTQTPPSQIHTLLIHNTSSHTVSYTFTPSSSLDDDEGDSANRLTGHIEPRQTGICALPNPPNGNLIFVTDNDASDESAAQHTVSINARTKRIIIHHYLNCIWHISQK